VDQFHQEDLDAHLSEPFPPSVDKGEVYGVVDPVLVGADIVGYIRHGQLDPVPRRSLREIADQLARSLDAFPADARPYFQRLQRIAQRAAAAE
jgi:hypothetical protein